MMVHSLMTMSQTCQIKDLLALHHRLIRSLYRYYSCMNSTDNNNFYMDSTALCAFCTDNELINEDLTMADLEAFQK